MVPRLNWRQKKSKCFFKTLQCSMISSVRIKHYWPYLGDYQVKLVPPHRLPLLSLAAPLVAARRSCTLWPLGAWLPTGDWVLGQKWWSTSLALWKKMGLSNLCFFTFRWEIVCCFKSNYALLSLKVGFCKSKCVILNWILQLLKKVLRKKFKFQANN